MKWHKRFLDLAAHIADWSKDPSTKVGAVVVDGLNRVVGVGYNGFPRGVDDSSERYADRAEKYPRVVHAELNAILNSNSSCSGGTIYVTLPPCASCAAAIIQSGIDRVIMPRSNDPATLVRWAESFAITDSMLGEAGIEVEYV